MEMKAFKKEKKRREENQKWGRGSWVINPNGPRSVVRFRTEVKGYDL